MTRIFYLAQEPLLYAYANQIAQIGAALYGKLWLAGELPQAEARFVTTTDIEPGVPPIVRLHTAGLQIEPPLNAVGPFRYWDERRERTFWQTVQHWWETLRWEPSYIHYRPVQPGDPDYDYAPYEETWVWLRPGGTGYVEAPKVSVN